MMNPTRIRAVPSNRGMGFTSESSSMPDWGAIRDAYEHGSLRIVEICDRFGVSKGALENRKRREDWTPRSAGPASNRTLLIRRMFTVLDRQVQRLEMKSLSEQTDKEAALLGSLANTMRKLIEMDRAEASHQRQPTETREMQDIREKLAKRIDALTKG